CRLHGLKGWTKNMIETVFKGATRPPMKFGVPLVPLVVLLLPGFISGMWLSTMVNWRFAPVIFGSLAVAYIWMRIVTSRDDQRLTQLVLKLKLAVRNPNRVLRNGARSYAPIGYRGGRHVWRR
ncbi:MAG: VirB3 family type IV secretion system protein, partial [Rubrivivax sp.]|nr:VirB3 family type IV secretion system protein [Rubrivivax sp.]